ncbi:C25 family cysteine peptidase [uncultured Photobacterium sp.]|uniref:C25 family cysteine peptidase n=1 Tax=uncultured Photobacterium sp. TaxID=173973 RepID=UPI0026033CB6|nr:C25 family cysteine peptidase [uncultured Photobacterium sp.]
MKLNKTRLLLTLALFSQSTFAVDHTDAMVYDKQVINFDQLYDSAPLARTKQASENFTLINQEGSRALFEAKLTTLTMGKVKMADGNVYNRIMLPDAGSPAAPGLPNLTGYQQMVRIPDGAKLNIIIENVEWSETFNDIMVDPVQLPFPDVVKADGSRPDENMPFVKKEGAYKNLTDSVTAPVSIVDTIRVRGKNYAVISYRPIDFNPINETVRFAKKVRFHVNYVLTDGTKTKREDKLNFEAPTDSIIDLRPQADQKADAVFTPGRQENNEELTPAQQADYLIITADRFAETIEPLAAWKRKKGYNVHVATITETGNTQEQIKAYIKGAYEKGPMTSYVLLVGDNEDVPAYEIVGHFHHGINHRWHTDYEYTLVDGTDKYSDLVIGRFPGDTEDQITTMVNRTLAYEKTPVDSDRYSHVLLAGQFQDRNKNLQADRMFMEDLHRVADFLGPDYDFFNGPGDLFNKGFQIHTALEWDADLDKELKYGGWSYGTARITPPRVVPQAWKNQGKGDRFDIANAINQGVSFVMHRDHGYDDGSGWADPHFVAQNVNALTNGNLAPVVFSLNCATGWFDGKDSFAEAWMRNPNGGAVGFTGAARVSLSGYNDLMHAGIMDSFWDDYDGTWSSNIYPVSWRPAMALTRAKERLFSHFGTLDHDAVDTARYFNWFGDPELELRTERPKELTVTHPVEFASNGEITTFDVVVRNGDERIENARVALVSESGESHIATTDENGVAHFELEANEAMTVTVTEHNAIAYEGEIKADGQQSAPVARVASEVTTPGHKWIILDGTQSEIPEGAKVQYKWEQASGPKVRLAYADNNYAYALTPYYSTTLKFKLTITDENNQTDSAIQTVHVNGIYDDDNKAPIAHAGNDKTASHSEWVTLDATKSSDPDGKVVSYKWTQIAGPATEIAYSDENYAYALTPRYDATLKFQVTVTDDKGKTSSSTNTIVVKGSLR